MKKILITGKNSYIGTKFKERMAQWPDEYEVTEISVRGEDWKKVDFSSYDTVLHVAGIVHTKENENNVDLFYKVNRDLTLELAKKVKSNKAKQFIFMSTMNVYGMTNGVITKDTPCDPKTAYGKSKLEAEKLLLELQDENFNISIVRPPMVYGPNTVGNYVSLSKLAKITPIFPNVNNQRSMIYIENLSEFLRLIIEDNASGIYCPQNADLVQTSEMVCLIAQNHDHTIWFTKAGNFLIKLLANNSLVKKIFGDLYYDKSMSNYKNNDYQIKGLETSIYLSEKENR